MIVKVCFFTEKGKDLALKHLAKADILYPFTGIRMMIWASGQRMLLIKGFQLFL